MPVSCDFTTAQNGPINVITKFLATNCAIRDPFNIRALICWNAASGPFMHCLHRNSVAGIGDGLCPNQLDGF